MSSETSTLEKPAESAIPAQHETKTLEAHPLPHDDQAATKDDGSIAPPEPSSTITPVAVTGAIKVAISALKPHPRNESIYGSDLDDIFVQSVERNGIFHPLLVTHDHFVISGNRRFAAAKKLGITEVAVVYFASDDPLDIETALVEANRQRAKTNEHIGREFNLLVEIESKRAALRMATNKEGQGVKPLTQAEKGKARDLAAEKIGKISGVSAEKAGKVAGAIEKLTKKNHTKKAEELRETLNKNIEKAQKLAIEWGELPAPAVKVPKGSKSASPAKESVVPATANETAHSQDSAKVAASKPSADSKLEVVIPSASGASTGGRDDEAHFKALEQADAAVTFLRSRESNRLTEKHKQDWKRAGDDLAKALLKLGIKISAA